MDKHTPDLVSSVVRLQGPTSGRQRGAFLGREVHALILDLVASVDPGLAQIIHDAPTMKPFTGSPLFWEGGRAWFRIASLGPRITKSLIRAFREWRGPVRLADGLYELQGVETDERAHRWAAKSSYEVLWDRHTRCLSPARGPIVLRFHTPTTFRRGRTTLPLPEPGIIFQSLLAKWNAFSPRPITGLQEYVEQEVRVGRYALETSLLDLGRQRQFLGFKGTCEFSASDTSDERFRMVRLLADFAFFAGVGHKATMGMGMAAPEPSDRAGGLIRALARGGVK